MRHTCAAQTPRQILDQAAPIVVREPILEVMEPRKIFAGALPAAITIQLDVMQHPLRRPILFRFTQHPREAERDLIKRPAIHPVEIHRRRLDPIIDLERERFVARADERPAHRRGPFANRKRLPILLLCLAHQIVESIAPLENRPKRQPRFRVRCRQH